MQDELLAMNDNWTLRDHLNTLRDVINMNGKVVSHLEYNAFGKLISSTGEKLPFRYTGKMFDDATGLQWNINRWYDADVGRWISEDPIGFIAGDTNLYRYCGLNPILFVDSEGRRYRINIISGVDHEAPLPGSLPANITLVARTWSAKYTEWSYRVHVRASSHYARWGVWGPYSANAGNYEADVKCNLGTGEMTIIDNGPGGVEIQDRYVVASAAIYSQIDAQNNKKGTVFVAAGAGYSSNQSITLNLTPTYKGVSIIGIQVAWQISETMKTGLSKKWEFECVC